MNNIRAIVERYGEAGAKQLRIEVSAQGNNEEIIIGVNDNGIGLDPGLILRRATEKGIVSEKSTLEMKEKDVLDLIFDPRFSTREGGGEGLHEVRGHVERCGGSIKVESAGLGKGVTFTIILPAFREQSLEEVVNPAQKTMQTEI